MEDTVQLPDIGWARRQRMLAVTGAVLGVAALVLSILGLTSYPRSADDQNWYAVLAVAGSGVLAACCLLNLISWSVAVGHWNREVDLESRTWSRASMGAHVLSYLAVLVGMYAMLAASAIAGWSSPPGRYFGIAFLLIIFAQVLGGTQRLRRHGPPGTIPNYLRQLNAKVQSLR